MSENNGRMYKSDYFDRIAEIEDKTERIKVLTLSGNFTYVDDFVKNLVKFEPNDQKLGELMRILFAEKNPKG